MSMVIARWCEIEPTISSPESKKKEYQLSTLKHKCKSNDQKCLREIWLCILTYLFLIRSCQPQCLDLSLYFPT